MTDSFVDQPNRLSFFTWSDILDDFYYDLDHPDPLVVKYTLERLWEMIPDMPPSVAKRARTLANGDPGAEPLGPPPILIRNPIPALEPDPIGDARSWWRAAAEAVPGAARMAHRIAVLCRDDTRTVVSYDRLAETTGSMKYYVQACVRLLEEMGWLRAETTGKGRGARTTFTLQQVTRK